MYNIYLRGRLRKYSTYGVGKFVQVVSAGNQYILHSASLQISLDPIQNEKLSDFPTHMPRTFFKPFCFRPTQR